MSDDTEGDLAAVSWPGFVDILSACIIMFIFLVLITIITLYETTVTYKAKIIREIDGQGANLDVSEATRITMETNKILEKKLEILEEQKKVLEQSLAERPLEFYQARAEFTESEGQSIVHEPEKRELTIFFSREAISLTEDIKVQIIDIVDQYLEKDGAEGFYARVEASVNPGFVIQNSARQIAVARMFNVRNIFVEKEIPAAQLQPQMIPGYEINESFSWVKVHFKREDE